MPAIWTAWSLVFVAGINGKKTHDSIINILKSLNISMYVHVDKCLRQPRNWDCQSWFLESIEDLGKQNFHFSLSTFPCYFKINYNSLIDTMTFNKNQSSIWPNYYWATWLASLHFSTTFFLVHLLNINPFTFISTV